MSKVTAFLILFMFSLSSLITIYTVDAHIDSSSPTHQGLFEDMWSHISGMPTSTQSYLWIIPLLLIGAVIISVAGLAYFVAFPEIKSRATIEEGKHVSGLPLSPYEATMKVLTPEERKVLEILITHEGKYLQKYIRNEAGLSRVKTHRIIACLVERGIVTLKKSGNTNEVLLADWLKQAQR